MQIREQQKNYFVFHLINFKILCTYFVHVQKIDQHI